MSSKKGPPAPDKWKPPSQIVTGDPPKRGRPTSLVADEATLKEIRGLGALQCTHREAAGFLRVSEKTFDTFLREDEDAREAWDGGKEEGKISLRRKQLRLAEKSAGMAIFLGKNYLDQADRHEITGAQGGPLQYQNLSEDDLNAKLIALFAGASPGAAHGEEAGASEPDGGSLDMEDDPGGEE